MNRASLARRVDAGHENLRSHVAGSSPPNLLRAHSMAGKRAVRPVIEVPMLIAPGKGATQMGNRASSGFPDVWLLRRLRHYSSEPGWLRAGAACSSLGSRRRRTRPTPLPPPPAGPILPSQPNMTGTRTPADAEAKIKVPVRRGDRGSVLFLRQPVQLHGVRVHAGHRRPRLRPGRARPGR